MAPFHLIVFLGVSIAVLSIGILLIQSVFAEQDRQELERRTAEKARRIQRLRERY